MADASISNGSGLNDSPLSVTASVAGILTFVVALAAAAYVRITYLRNADQEYFQVKASLSWYKTESAWMYDLVNAADMRTKRPGNEKEYQMYAFVMEQLGKLEERLLSLLTQAEVEANKQPGPKRERSWTLIPQRYQVFKFPTSTATAVSWLSVRTKALELVRQRDALGSRVLFAQLSMISSRVIDQDVRARKTEEGQRDRLDRLERIVRSQSEKLDRLESLVYRVAATPASQSSPELRDLPSGNDNTNPLMYHHFYGQGENDTGPQIFRPFSERRTSTPPPLPTLSLDSSIISTINF